MALLTFANLKTGIQEYVQNSEQTFVDNLPNFIRAAEDRVYANVQIPSFFKSISPTIVAGTNNYTVLGMIEVLDVRLDSSGAAGTGWTTLLRKDWDFLREAYPDTSSGTGRGLPRYWSVSNASRNASDPELTIRIAPTPDLVYGFDIDYYGKVVADMLEGATSGTWLSATWPNILLYGCLVEAYTFMKGEADLVAFYEKRFLEGLEKMGMTSSGEQKNRLKPPMRV